MHIVLSKNLNEMKVEIAHKIDSIYSVKASDIFGLNFQIHMLKRNQASLGIIGDLISSQEDLDSIIENVKEEDLKIANLDKERRALKKELESLDTVIKIEEFKTKLDKN